MIAAVSEPTPRRVRVLLVAEYLLTRAGLRWMLESERDVDIVGEASTGEEAVAMAAACRPDVVVMDLDMAGDAGVSAMRTITAPDQHPAILALTKHSEDERLVDALRAGASGYLSKNVERAELMAALRTTADGGIHVRPHVGQLLAEHLRRPTAPTGHDQARAKFQALSDRERAVLRLVAEGNTGPQIGGLLGITAKTVDTYRHRIREKLGLAQRTDYLRFALSLDLLAK